MLKYKFYSFLFLYIFFIYLYTNDNIIPPLLHSVLLVFQFEFFYEQINEIAYINDLDNILKGFYRCYYSCEDLHRDYLYQQSVEGSGQAISDDIKQLGTKVCVGFAICIAIVVVIKIIVSK